MAESVIIKPYSEDFLRDCVSLFAELGYPTNVVALEKRLSKLLKNRDYYLDLAIFEDQAVGLIGYSKMSFFEYDGDYIRIFALAVDPAFQRLGVGSRLVNHVKHIAQINHFKAIALNSGLTIDRQKAHAFYEKNGFHQKSKGYTWIADGTDTF